MSSWYLYIAKCSDNSLYIGISNNVDKRIVRHNQGDGATWVKQHGAAEIVYRELYQNYLEARHREMQIKKWSRVKKEHLVSGLKP